MPVQLLTAKISFHFNFPYPYAFILSVLLYTYFRMKPWKKYSF